MPGSCPWGGGWQIGNLLVGCSLHAEAAIEGDAFSQDEHRLAVEYDRVLASFGLVYKAAVSEDHLRRHALHAGRRLVRRRRDVEVGAARNANVCLLGNHRSATLLDRRVDHPGIDAPGECRQTGALNLRRDAASQSAGAALERIAGKVSHDIRLRGENGLRERLLSPLIEPQRDRGEEFADSLRPRDFDGYGPFAHISLAGWV